jgi:hypothetical protein
MLGQARFKLRTNPSKSVFERDLRISALAFRKDDRDTWRRSRCKTAQLF